MNLQDNNKQIQKELISFWEESFKPHIFQNYITKSTYDTLDNELSIPSMIKQIENEFTKEISSKSLESTLPKEQCSDLLSIKESTVLLNEEFIESSENVIIYPQVNNHSDALISSEFYDEDEREGENIIYDSKTIGTNYTITKEVHFITINLFMKKIALEKYTNQTKELIKAFILQSSTFIKLNILVDKIMNAFWYYHEKQLLQYFSIIFFLNDIIFKQYMKIIKDDALFNKLHTFYLNITQINFVKNDYTENDLKSILFLLEEKREEFDYKYTKKSMKPRKKSVRVLNKQSKSLKPNLSFQLIDNIFLLDDWNNESIAKQLTFISFNKMSDINMKEIIGARCSKETNQLTSPKSFELIKRSSQLVHFIIEDILSYDFPEDRARMIERWVDIGFICKSLNNFNDTMVISLVFCNYLLKDLDQTWKKVNEVYKNKITSLKSFCSCEQSYKNIRTKINDCMMKNIPYVPYFGLLLKEICYIEEKIPTLKDNTLINIEKIKMVRTELQKFFKFSIFKYNFNPETKLNILEKINPKTEDELEEVNKLLEPSFTLRKRQLKEKRPTNTDTSYFQTLFSPFKSMNVPSRCNSHI